MSQSDLVSPPVRRDAPTEVSQRTDDVRPDDAGAWVADLQRFLKTLESQYGFRSTSFVAMAQPKDVEHVLAQLKALFETTACAFEGRSLTIYLQDRSSAAVRCASAQGPYRLEQSITGEVIGIARLVSMPLAPVEPRPKESYLVLDVYDRGSGIAYASFRSKSRRQLYKYAPLLFARLESRDKRRGTDRLLRQLTGGGPKHAFPALAGLPAGDSGRPEWVLFCCYWLDLGGAESWAIETMRVAKSEGKKIVVFCDQPSRDRLLARVGAIADHVFLAGRLVMDNAHELLMKVLERFRPSLVHIHHCFTAYECLVAIRARHPGLRVVDTTHIFEREYGGFPAVAAAHSPLIDAHHVISRQLRDLMIAFGVLPEKLYLGYLNDMARLPARAEQPRHTGDITVAFLGRFEAQKRPELFLLLAERLKRRNPGRRFRFLMQGEGALKSLLGRVARRRKLAADVTFLDGTASVANLLSRSDALVLSSDNEGLALVSMEAMQLGVPLISADVGGQNEIVLPDMLVPAEPAAFLDAASRLVVRLADDAAFRAATVEAQRERLRDFQQQVSGTQVVAGFYEGRF